jgi:hypothetical protein
MGLDTKTYWLTDRQSQCNFNIPKSLQNHDNENVGTIGQGEARHRKYRRLKLGGGQAYGLSSD